MSLGSVSVPTQIPKGESRSWQEGRHLWHSNLLKQRMHLPPYYKKKKKNQEPLAHNVPWSPPPNHELLVITPVLKSQKSILRPKCNFALQTSRKFVSWSDSNWNSLAGDVAALIISQEISAATEESKRNIFQGTLAKLRKLASILKYQLAFPSHLQNSLDESWPLNTHRNVQFGYFVRPDPVSRRRMLQWGWKCPVAETLCRTPRAVQPSVQVLCVLSRSIFGHFWLNPLAAVMRTHLAGREKSSALGLSLFLCYLGSIFSPNTHPKSFLLLSLSSLHLLSTNHPSLDFSPMLIFSSFNAPSIPTLPLCSFYHWC